MKLNSLDKALFGYIYANLVDFLPASGTRIRTGVKSIKDDVQRVRFINKS